MRRRGTWAILVVAAVLAGAPARAQASDVSCAEAAESAQALRREKKLLRSQAQLLRCGDPKCPSFVRGDCLRWLEEVRGATPSLVVRAVDAAGHDVLDATVRIDDAAGGALGAAISLDPGPHTLVVDAGGARGETRVLVAEGEKNRVVVVTLGPRAAPSPRAEPRALPAPSPDPAASEPRPGVEPTRGGPSPFAYVAAGVGVAGLATFGVLQLVAQGDYDDLKGQCGTSCDPQRVDPIRTKVIASGVALGVGVVGAAVAVALFATSSRSTTGALTVAPTGDGGAVARARLTF